MSATQCAGESVECESGKSSSSVPTEPLSSAGAASTGIIGVDASSSRFASCAARSRLMAFLRCFRAFRLARAFSKRALGSSVAFSVRPTSSMTSSTSSGVVPTVCDVSESLFAETSPICNARDRRIAPRSSSTRLFSVKLNNGAVSRREKQGFPPSSITFRPASLMSRARIAYAPNCHGSTPSRMIQVSGSTTMMPRPDMLRTSSNTKSGNKPLTRRIECSSRLRSEDAPSCVGETVTLAGVSTSARVDSFRRCRRSAPRAPFSSCPGAFPRYTSA